MKDLKLAAWGCFLSRVLAATVGPALTLCFCSLSQISMRFASSPTRTASTRSMSSSMGATWLEVPSKCASGSPDKRGTRRWCPPTARGSRGAPQVTHRLPLSSSAEPAPGTEPRGSLQACAPVPRDTGMRCTWEALGLITSCCASAGSPCQVPGPGAGMLTQRNTAQHRSFRGFPCLSRIHDACNWPPGRSLPISASSGPQAPRNALNGR